jgi:hypothetical protein
LGIAYLQSDIELDGDTVLTPKFELHSNDLVLQGSGQFVRDGDMDFDVRVEVTPEAAERIPLLRDNFNIQGHKMSNQDIELAFHIGGPTFKPRGELAALPPASVTLVSGALEVTREAINIIDFPRKVLMDLLRLGGGIVGAGTNR